MASATIPSFLGRQSRRLLDLATGSALVRWTWVGLVEPRFEGSLGEFRPADSQMVIDLMAGRFLLGGRLADIGNQSPFAIEAPDAIWQAELESFSWLRHFASARPDNERQFARRLVIDWIARRSRYQLPFWGQKLTGLRVLNWLRHLPLLLEGATKDESRSVRRVLATQIQMLRMRWNLADRSEDRVIAMIALAGAALCDGSGLEPVASRIEELVATLGAETDADGLHLSRNPAIQLEILTELAAIRQNMSQRPEIAAAALDDIAGQMHTALDHLILPTGEPAFFNGAGPVPIDLVMALQSQSIGHRRRSGIIAGYGVLSAGKATLIADSGRLPPRGNGSASTASGLAFEFAHGGDLVIGSRGPIRSNDFETILAYRLGAAHSGPTIDDLSLALPIHSGPGRGELNAPGGPPSIELEGDAETLLIQTSALVHRSGLRLERRLSLIADGDTLVGRDKVLPGRGTVRGLHFKLRFHLAPRAIVSLSPGEQIVRITLQSGAEWTFLWEGADVEIADSSRQTGHFGMMRTEQIIVTTELESTSEIAWMVTRQST